MYVKRVGVGKRAPLSYFRVCCSCVKSQDVKVPNIVYFAAISGGALYSTLVKTWEGGWMSVQWLSRRRLCGD